MFSIRLRCSKLFAYISYIHTTILTLHLLHSFPPHSYAQPRRTITMSTKPRHVWLVIYSERPDSLPNLPYKDPLCIVPDSPLTINDPDIPVEEGHRMEPFIANRTKFQIPAHNSRIAHVLRREPSWRRWRAAGVGVRLY